MHQSNARPWRKQRFITRLPSHTQETPGSHFHKPRVRASILGNDACNSVHEQEEVMMQEPTLRSNIFAFFFIFFNTTTIHGLNHTVSLKRFYIENILWSIMVCLAISGAVALSLNIWTRYKTNPTAITMERDYTSWNTTAPAITLCPFTHYDETKLNKFIDSFENKDMVNITDLKKMLMIISNSKFQDFLYIPEISESVLKPESYLDTVFAIRANLELEQQNSAERSDIPVIEVLTEMGFCYTFHTFVAQYNKPEYWKNKTLKASPNTFSELYGHPTSGAIQQLLLSSGKIKYTIHSPYDVPDVASDLRTAEVGETKQMTVQALSTITTDEAKLLTIEQRKCRMAHENPLQISPEYTYHFCCIECRIRLTYRLCGCTPFFYKRIDDMPICGVKGMRCIGKHADSLIKLEESGTKIKMKDCKCLPRCDEVSYYIETISDAGGFFLAGVQVKIGKYPAMRLKRDVIFGFADLWVSIGGSGGLFLGCSVLSVIEIFYFLSLRLFLYVRKGHLMRSRNNKPFQ